MVSRQHKDGYFTRDELCLRWACSIGLLKRLEEDGWLIHEPFSPGSPSNATRFYPELQIQEIEAKRVHGHKNKKKKKGRRAKGVVDIERRVFALFAANVDALEIVDMLRIPFKLVESLYEVYKNHNLERRYREKLIKAAAKIADED